MRMLSSRVTAVVLGALAVAAPVFAQPQPEVPPALEVPAGHVPFLWLRAAGTQNYVCLPAGAGFAWTFFGPQATLFNQAARQEVTHFLSPNPDEGGLPRPTWLHSRDSSAVWARALASSTDAAYVAPGAIPWLLLEITGAQSHPHGAGTLTRARYIHRIATEGGVAPASGCGVGTVGAKALVPYTTEYVFYRERAGQPQP
jgi:hypothetical protein